MKLSSLSIAYLKLIERSSSITLHGLEKIRGNVQVGFWHQDSLMMCLVLKMARRMGLPITVVATADPRGDTIEDMVRAFDGEIFRLSYAGQAAHRAIKDLIRHVREKTVNVATPLDGPLGPLHDPKKFLFLLAHKTARNFVGIRIEYARKLSLFTRWDKYVIPLPFNRINVHIYDLGPVGAEDLRNFAAYKGEVRRRLLSGADFAAISGRVGGGDEETA